MTRRELQEMRKDIAALQRDLAAVRCRVWDLEHDQYLRIRNGGGRKPPARYQAGYPHGLGKGHE